MLSGALALTIAAAFTGAAFYVGAVEQPARMQLDDRALLTQWKPSYKGGFAMQATLAVLGFLAGLWAWWQTGGLLWLAGAIVLIANWPFTLIAILPTNNALMEIPVEHAGPRSRALLVTWGHLHSVRTLLGAVSTVIFLWAQS